MLQGIVLKKKHIPAALFLILISAVFFLNTSASFKAHSSPIEMDTKSYLQDAEEINALGGILQLPFRMVTGEYRQATQHPLYTSLLALVSDVSLEGFVKGKKLTVFLGWLFFMGSVGLVGGEFGKVTAMMYGLFLCLNATFFRLTSMIACEVLLGMFVFLFWIFMIRGVKKSGYWYLSGLSAGLAFMTKSIGIFLIPYFILFVFMVAFRNRNWQLFKKKEFLGFFALFLIVASPLLVRNLVVYSTPLFSDSSAVLWVEDWSEYSEDKAEQNRFSFRNYLETHGISHMMFQLKRGMTVRTVQMLQDYFKPVPFWKKYDYHLFSGFHKKTADYQIIWMGAAFILILAGLITQRKTCLIEASIPIMLIFWPFIGWYSKIFDATPPTRLWHSPGIILIVLAAAGAASIFNGIFRKYSVKITAAVLILFSATTLMQFPYQKVSAAPSVQLNPLFRLQYNVIRQVAGSGETVLVSKPFSLNYSYVPDSQNPTIIKWPAFGSWEEVRTYLKQKGVVWVLLDLPVYIENRELFSGYFTFDVNKGIRMIKQPPLPMVRIQLPDQISSVFELFRVSPQ